MNDDDSQCRAWAVLAQLALNTLGTYRADVRGENPRTHLALQAVGQLGGLHTAGRIVARAFGISHGAIEERLGWALSLLPVQGAQLMSETDPGDRFQALRAMGLRALDGGEAGS